MIETSLHSYLANAQTLVSACAGRIEPVRLPNDPSLPTLTYQVISTTPDATLDGPSGFMEKRIQFSSWGECYGDAKALDEALRTVLDGFSGLQPDGTLIFNVMLDTAADLYEPDSKLYHVSTDYKVQFSQ